MSIFSRKNKFKEYEELKSYAVEKLRNSTEPDECLKWANLLADIDRLEERKKAPFGRVSPDAILQTAGSLLGIGIICSYEHLHVLASKALPFVIKLR